jgi:hypothetical protein
MAGLPAGPNDIHRTCGQAVVDLTRALSQCSGLNTMLNDTSRGFGTANLTAIFTAAGDPQASSTAGLIIASFADLQNLYAVAHGQQAQPAASNFFFHAANLMGVNPIPI